jgi:hypothetical protein
VLPLDAITEEEEHLASIEGSVETNDLLVNRCSRPAATVRDQKRLRSPAVDALTGAQRG